MTTNTAARLDTRIAVLTKELNSRMHSRVVGDSAPWREVLKKATHVVPRTRPSSSPANQGPAKRWWRGSSIARLQSPELRSVSGWRTTLDSTGAQA
jgi:hypothetical protein